MLGKFEEEKGAAKPEMVGWHQRLNGHESEQTLGDSGDRGARLQFMGSQRVRDDLVTKQQQRGKAGVG